MKNFRLLLLSVLGVVAMTASCTKSSTDNTWHPSKSMITVVTDWGITEKPIWTNYSIEYTPQGGTSTTIPAYGRAQDLPLQNPGQYDILVYNNGEGFTFPDPDNDNVVKINEVAPGVLYSDPNQLAIFYTGKANVTAVKDQNVQVPVTMVPHMRKLNVRIYLNNDPIFRTEEKPSGFRTPVKGVTATITGIANTYNVETGDFGGSYTVNIPFNVLTDTELDKRYLNCDLNLLGINGNEQIVNLKIEFEFGDDLIAEPKNYHNELVEADFNHLASYGMTGSVDMALIPSGNVTIEEYTDGGTEGIDVGESAYTYALFDRYPNVNINNEVEGIVVWTTPDGKHGLVLGGEQSGDVTWATTANIEGTSYSMGYRNSLNMEAYLGNHPAETMGMTRWLQATYGAETGWFIPARAEFDILMDLMADYPGDLEAALAREGFMQFGGSYWTSETIAQIINPGPPITTTPATIYVWDGTDYFSTAAHYIVGSVTNYYMYNSRALRFF